MGGFSIFQEKEATPLLIEASAGQGLFRIGRRAAQDIGLVAGKQPELVGGPSGVKGTRAIVAAILGSSMLLQGWQEAGKFDCMALSGKREVYSFGIVPQPFPENPKVGEALVIAGSDLLGTIYGLFHLTEMCGVSPLVYWGDAKPVKRQEVILEVGDGFVSKEPSVKYRGFFINDEWPAFGNWCTEHFGGINAKAYEEIFILLLRMKGNYIWPAMWDSVFSEDGPGLANAELADMYGITVGLSHHEPMCRAGAEWQRVYKQYGESGEWSFITNAGAITDFWKDGILRNKPFKNLITIGMRGENDSQLLSEKATMADNIQVVKDAILAQHKLIREYIDKDLGKVPRMLAIYKEVEDFYYGDATCGGLKDWDELKDVIFMLCDDNFGNTRGLPQAGDAPHPGGYGMYYHFDYHGAPVSYEWQNSSRLTKTWEQMTHAYEHGVRDLWIVNVGDIKGVEYPLSYFMELAYDYETWGQPDMVEVFVKKWIKQQFGTGLGEGQEGQLLALLDGWTKWGAARRPEAMNPSIYHPYNFHEGDRVWREVSETMRLAGELRENLPASCQDAYGSLVYYPAMATLNLVLMHVEAGMNAHFARRGSLAANAYAESVKKRAEQDMGYVRAYHGMLGGKWNHMMDSAHTGFRSWDAQDWTYPAVQQVIPVPAAKITVGFRGDFHYHLGAHWQDGEAVCNEEFTRPDTAEVLIDLDSRGNVDFTFSVHSDKEWLGFEPPEGSVDALKEGRATITVTCDREKLAGREKALVEIPVKFANGETTVGRLALVAGMEGEMDACPEGTFLEQLGYIAMEAAHFSGKKDVSGGGFRVIRHLGRMGDAVKSFPVTKSWIGSQDVPSLWYDFAAKEAGVYIVQLYFAPRNPGRQGGHIRCQVSVNDEKREILETITSPFYTEWRCAEWNNGVMDNIRIVKTAITVRKGLNRLYFYAGDPGIVLEKIVLYREGNSLPDSYFGPVESFRV